MVKEPTLRDIGALLEQVRDDVSAVADGVQGNAERLDGHTERFDGIAGRLDRMEKLLNMLREEVADIRVMLGTPEDSNVITKDAHSDLERRVSQIEKALAKLGQTT